MERKHDRRKIRDVLRPSPDSIPIGVRAILDWWPIAALASQKTPGTWGKRDKGRSIGASPPSSYALPSFLPSKTPIMAKKTKAELQDTVIYLERELEETKKRLQFYEQHFKSCRTASPISPPPDHQHNDTSVRRTLEEPPAEGRGSTNTTASTQHTALVSHEDVHVKRALTNTEAYSNPSTLKDHEASNPNTTSDTSGGQVPGAQKRKQWENDAFTLAAKFKKPRREQRYLEPLSSHDAIITSIVHGTSCDIQALSMNPSMDPIAAVKRYAIIARDSRVRAELASRISSFQDLIFHSMCVVLEYCGYPVEDIDMAMRIRSSASGPKNLKRLRSGAGWANEVISKSTGGEWTGMSDCIAELYFHCEWFYYSNLKPKLTGARRYQDVGVRYSGRLEDKIHTVLRPVPKSSSI